MHLHVSATHKRDTEFETALLKGNKLYVLDDYSTVRHDI